MSQKKDLTLQQLAQISLGDASLDSIKISLLHTIIDVTLKKLDCENEKVIISGLPAEHLRKLLQESNIGPALKLDENDIKVPVKSYEKIKQLEEQVKAVEDSLEEHLTCANVRIIPGEEIFSESCPPEFDTEEQKDETISTVLKSSYITNEVVECMSQVFNCRMFKIDTKLNKLTENIEDLKKDYSKTMVMMDKVDILSMDFLNLHKDINVNNLKFESTMAEIQGAMDLKANNCEIIPFKESFQTRIDHLNRYGKELIEDETKLRALVFSVKPLEKLNNSVESIENPKEPSLKSKKSGKACDCEEGRGINKWGLPDRAIRISMEDVLRRSFDKAKVRL